jgi:hypothetical protein
VDYGFVTHDQFIKYGKEFARNCRARNNCAGILGEEVIVCIRMCGQGG